MLLLALLSPAHAQTVVLEGEVPDDGYDHFFLPFEVPAGIAEIEVRHDDLSDDNILDWGLNDPNGWRGWGGGNTEPAVLDAQAASRSYVPGAIVPGTWQVVVGKAKIADPPGQYHVEVVLRRDTTLAPQPERQPYADVPALEVGPRWYAGDLHVHSRESGDASATLDEIADLAAARGLDFVFVTDHNTVSHLDWLADAQSRHPDVLLLPGTEFTTYAGHANAWGVRGWVDHTIGQPGVTIEAAAAAYVQQGALLSINHPALDLGDLCIGCAWSLPVPVEQLSAVEIGTGGWEPVGMLFTPDAIAFWDGLCDQGYHVAAVGGSDDHRAGTDTGPFASLIGNPTTMVWADELSAGALLDGLAGRTSWSSCRGPRTRWSRGLGGGPGGHRRGRGAARGPAGDRRRRAGGGPGDHRRRPVPVLVDGPPTMRCGPEARGRVAAHGEQPPRLEDAPAPVAEDPKGCGCGTGGAAWRARAARARAGAAPLSGRRHHAILSGWRPSGLGKSASGRRPRRSARGRPALQAQRRRASSQASRSTDGTWFVATTTPPGAVHRTAGLNSEA
ncbi:MAG: CehA/McbA family metallohydrolase [Myxococcota bacterium]